MCIRDSVTAWTSGRSDGDAQVRRVYIKFRDKSVHCDLYNGCQSSTPSGMDGCKCASSRIPKQDGNAISCLYSRQNSRSSTYNGVTVNSLSLIHISEPTRLLSISYAVFCLKKKK